MTDDSQHTQHCPNCEQTARERDEERNNHLAADKAERRLHAEAEALRRERDEAVALRKRETELLKAQRDAEVQRRANAEAAHQLTIANYEAVQREADKAWEKVEELFDQQGIIAQDRARRVKERDEAVAVLQAIADARGLNAELWRRIDAIVEAT